MNEKQQKVLALLRANVDHAASRFGTYSIQDKRSETLPMEEMERLLKELPATEAGEVILALAAADGVTNKDLAECYNIAAQCLVCALDDEGEWSDALFTVQGIDALY